MVQKWHPLGKIVLNPDITCILNATTTSSNIPSKKVFWYV
jgi:hypothetical protein